MEVAELILGPAEKGGNEGKSEGDEYETVASEIILGVQERNPRLLAKGLKAFIAMCEASGHSEGADTEY